MIIATPLNLTKYRPNETADTIAALTGRPGALLPTNAAQTGTSLLPILPVEAQNVGAVLGAKPQSLDPGFSQPNIPKISPDTSVQLQASQQTETPSLSPEWEVKGITPPVEGNPADMYGYTLNTIRKLGPDWQQEVAKRRG